MILVFVVLPLVVFLSLALLPRGAPAAGGIAVAVAVVAALWLLAGEGEDADVARILHGMAGIGIGMAAIAQALRLAMPNPAPRGLYGLVLAAVLALALLLGYVAIGGFL